MSSVLFVYENLDLKQFLAQLNCFSAQKNNRASVFYFDKSWIVPESLLARLGILKIKFRMIDIVDEITNEQVKIKLSRGILVDDFVHLFNLLSKNSADPSCISSIVASFSISKAVASGYLSDRHSMMRLHFCLHVINQVVIKEQRFESIKFFAKYREGVDLLDVKSTYPNIHVSFGSGLQDRILRLKRAVALSSISFYLIARVFRNPWLLNFLLNSKSNISVIELPSNALILGSFVDHDGDVGSFKPSDDNALRHNIFGRYAAIVKAAVAIHFFARKHFHGRKVKCAQYPCLELIRKKYIFDVLVWRFLFERRGVKNVLLWHKHSEKHLAIFEATRLNGGICSIWKRSFEGAKTIYNLNVADLLFEPNFNDTATLKGIGLDINSKFSQGIQVCGMIWGADENPFARFRTKLDRSCWISKGDFQGLTILVVDGGASLDSKWGVGSGYHIETYVTCMNLLDAFPRLRVIFLPKKLVNLPRILGLANWNRLEQLEDNGRCVLVDDQMRKIKSNSSLAEEVDLCIHSHMVAGTVGVECALSGVRTVFLDRECDERNVLNMLPVDTVIFKNWSDLSELLEKSMLNLDEFHNSSIGIWPKEVIDQLDPVGDGLGKLRVYSVLTKIEKLYLSGLDRARILDEVTSDYQDRVKWPEKSLR